MGGAYMWDLTFYLANTLPLPGPHLDVDIGTLDYKLIEAGLDTGLPSLGKDQLTGWPQCGRWSFPSAP